MAVSRLLVDIEGRQSKCALNELVEGAFGRNGARVVPSAGVEVGIYVHIGEDILVPCHSGFAVYFVHFGVNFASSVVQQSMALPRKVVVNAFFSFKDLLILWSVLLADQWTNLTMVCATRLPLFTIGADDR